MRSKGISFVSGKIRWFEYKILYIGARRLQKLNEISELQIKAQTANNSLKLIREEFPPYSLLSRLIGSCDSSDNFKEREEATIGQENSAKSEERLQSGLDEIEQQVQQKAAYLTSAIWVLSELKGEIA